jgi:hypothetical protein
MRGLRSFIVLLIIAIALGAYAWHESKQPASPESKLATVFPGLTSDKIDRVSVKSESGEQTTVEKKGDAWQVTQPTAVKADQAELSGITSNLASLEIQRVVDEKAADLKQYGLNPARVEVKFHDGGDHTLLVGQKTPTGSDLYARLPDSNRVFLIPSYLDTTFNRTAFDLRDKTVLAFDRDKVDHIDIAADGKTIALTKQGSDWRLTSPVDARADFGTVEGILGSLNTAQMKKIAAAEPGDLTQYGLDKPSATITLGAGSTRASLAFGKTEDGTVYAKDSSRPMVFTVDSSLESDVKKPADDFRVKDIFDARSFNTTRVEVARGGQTLAFEKSGDKWKQVTPSAKAADGTAVDALLTALTNARATGFVDKTAGTGLDKPELTVSLTYEDGKKQERVAFARHGSDAYAQREGDHGAAKIDPASLDAITKALDALK